jgi:hypothetical protein
MKRALIAEVAVQGEAHPISQQSRQALGEVYVMLGRREEGAAVAAGAKVEITAEDLIAE